MGSANPRTTSKTMTQMTILTNLLCLMATFCRFDFHISYAIYHNLETYQLKRRRCAHSASPLGIGYWVLGIDHWKAGKKAFSPVMTLDNSQYPIPNRITFMS